MATVSWRSTRYALHRLSNSSSSSTTTTTPTLLLGIRNQTRIQSLALSSSATSCRTAAEGADLNAKDDDNDDSASSAAVGQQNLEQNITEVKKNATPPTIVAVRPRASNAQSFHRIKLTPAKQQHQHVVSHDGAGEPNTVTVAASAAAAPRATCAARRSFVRIKPVTTSVLLPQNKTTVAVGGDDADALMMESTSSLRQNQHYKAHQQQQQHQQRVNTNYRQEQLHQPQQYRRHGKNNKHNNNNTNLSSSSPTVPFPTSCWVQVDGISPLSSLDAILATIQTALQQQQQQANGGGILDYLDSEDDATIPNSSSNDNDFPWVVERATVILSPFGRPNSWRLKFRNRSIVHALLTHAHEHPIQSGWKIVKIKECKDDEDNNNIDKEEERQPIVVSDATLRIENCSHDTTTYDLLNMFSRFDLAVRLSSSLPPSVHEWKGTTPEGRLAPPGTFLAHFADPSWARAALREKQGMIFKGRQLRLAQYPRQI